MTEPRDPTPAERELLELAIATRERAHAPYSRWAVGAAIETRSGKRFGGCNVENASFGLTICAERVALFKATSEGAGGEDDPVVRVAVVAAQVLPCPCGACRQVMAELAPDAEVILARVGDDQLTAATVKDLLPLAFEGPAE